MGDRPRYRWLILGMAAIVNFLPAGMAWTYVALIASPMVSDVGRGFESWGLLWSAIALGAMIASVVGGALGDRFGVRRVVGLGSLLMAVSLFARAQAPDYATLLATMVLFGLSLGVVAPNLSKTVGLWFPPEELGLANGIALGGNGAGVAVGAILTPYWAAWAGGWRPVTTSIAIIVAVLGVLWMVLVRDRSHGDAPAESLIAGVRRVAGVRDVWLIALCYLLFLGGYLGAYGYAPTYLQQHQGLTPESAGFMVSLVLWAFVVGSLVLPPWSDRIGLRRVVFAPAMGVAGLMLFFSALPTGPTLAGVMVGWGLAGGVVPLLFVVPFEMRGVGPTLGGAAVGLALTAGFLGGFIAPLIGMALVGIHPLLGFAFWGACYVAAGALFLSLRETGPRTRDD
jgi:nitrate/nitrite transporter NarK